MDVLLRGCQRGLVPPARLWTCTGCYGLFDSAELLNDHNSLCNSKRRCHGDDKAIEQVEIKKEVAPVDDNDLDPENLVRSIAQEMGGDAHTAHLKLAQQQSEQVKLAQQQSEQVKLAQQQSEQVKLAQSIAQRAFAGLRDGEATHASDHVGLLQQSPTEQYLAQKEQQELVRQAAARAMHAHQQQQAMVRAQDSFTQQESPELPQSVRGHPETGDLDFTSLRDLAEHAAEAAQRDLADNLDDLVHNSARPQVPSPQAQSDVSEEEEDDSKPEEDTSLGVNKKASPASWYAVEAKVFTQLRYLLRYRPDIAMILEQQVRTSGLNKPTRNAFSRISCFVNSKTTNLRPRSTRVRRTPFDDIPIRGSENDPEVRDALEELDDFEEDEIEPDDSDEDFGVEPADIPDYSSPGNATPPDVTPPVRNGRGRPRKDRSERAVERKKRGPRKIRMRSVKKEPEVPEDYKFNIFCKHCHMTCTTIPMLELHAICKESVNPGERYLQCNDCKSSTNFTSVNTVKGHIRMFHSGRKVNFFSCELCGKSFTCRKNLNRHLQNHTHVECKICNFTFPSVKACTAHYVQKHPEHVYPCDRCDKKFLSSRLLRNHIGYKHELKWPKKPYVPEEKNKQCPQCGKCFGANMKRHLATHRTFECWVCKQILFSYWDFHSHMKDVHNEYLLEKCDFCEQRFRTKRDLCTHYAAMHDERMPCEPCPKCSMKIPVSWMTTHLSDLCVYKTKANRPKGGVCTVCGKFVKNIDLHKKSHSDDRNFECPICHSSFKFKHHLKAHLTTHSDVRNFVCDICGDAFKMAVNLKLHKRKHGLSNTSVPMTTASTTPLPMAAVTSHMSAGHVPPMPTMTSMPAMPPMGSPHHMPMLPPLPSVNSQLGGQLPNLSQFSSMFGPRFPTGLGSPM